MASDEPLTDADLAAAEAAAKLLVGLPGKPTSVDWSGYWFDDLHIVYASLPARCLALVEEVRRLRAGRFTEEEFQALCHQMSEDDFCRFARGCAEYQAKLFGRSATAELEAENARLRDAIKLLIGRRDGVPWAEVPEEAVDSYARAAAELRGFACGGTGREGAKP